MRSFRLLAVAALVVVLVLVSAENAFALLIEMHPTCGQPPQVGTNGSTATGFLVTDVEGKWRIDHTETWGSGWENFDMICAGMTVVIWTIANLGTTGGFSVTFTDDISSAVATWTVDCPLPEAAVGGAVMPANALALVAPWLAVIALVGCISTVVVVAKKRRP